MAKPLHGGRGIAVQSTAKKEKTAQSGKYYAKPDFYSEAESRSKSVGQLRAQLAEPARKLEAANKKAAGLQTQYLQAKANLEQFTGDLGSKDGRKAYAQLAAQYRDGVSQYESAVDEAQTAYLNYKPLETRYNQELSGLNSYIQEQDEQYSQWRSTIRSGDPTEKVKQLEQEREELREEGRRLSTLVRLDPAVRDGGEAEARVLSNAARIREIDAEIESLWGGSAQGDLRAAQESIEQIQKQITQRKGLGVQLNDKLRQGTGNAYAAALQQAESEEEISRRIRENDAELQRLNEELKAQQEKSALAQEEIDWSKYYHYADLAGESDFTEMSKYRPQERKEQRALDIMLDNRSNDASGWEDPLYEYVNGNEEAGAYISDASANYYGADNALGKIFGRSTESKAESQQMTEQEVATFNYLYATQGKEAAHEYYNYLRTDLNYRQRKAEEEYWTEYAARDPVGSSVFSVAMVPAKGLSYLGQAGDMLATGEIDPNAAYNKFSYVPTAIRSQVSAQIEEKVEGVWGKAGSFAYQTGLSMADFLVATGISGGNSALAMTIMGSGAAADTTIAARERGVDSGKAFALGAVAGIAEAITEKVSLEALLNPKMLKDGALKYVAKNMLAEGGEEGASDLINLFADILIAGDQSEWQQSIDAYMADGMTEQEAFLQAFKDQALTIGLDMLGGAISGGILSGGNAAAQSRSNNWLAQKYDLENVNENDAQEIIASGLESGHDTESYQLAVKLQKKLDAGTIPSAQELSRLLWATEQAIQEEETVRDPSEDSNAGQPAAQEEDLQALSDARNMQATGMDTDFILQQTGWDVSGNGEPVWVGKDNTRTRDSVTADTEKSATQLRETQGTREDLVQGEDLNSLGTARNMQAVGMDAEAIRQQTGWDVSGYGEPVWVGKGRTESTISSYRRNGGTEHEDVYERGTANAGRSELLSGNGRRYDGTSTGEQAGNLAGRAGQTATRSWLGADAAGAAIARQNYARFLRLEKVSSLDLGLRNGTEARSIQVMPQEHWDNEMSRLADRIYDETGKGVSYVMGRIQIRGANGAVGYARGVITGDRIIVQADNLRVSMEQIADHEAYHAKVDFTGGRLNDEIRRHIVETFSEEQFQQVLDKYIVGLRGVIDVNEARTGEEFEAVVRQIEEEIFADAYAGINAFSANADRFTGAVNERMGQLNMGKVRSQDNGTEEPTGPPERFSISEIDGTEADYGEGVILDTDIFKGVKTRDWGKVLSKFVYENLAGTEITTYTESGQPEVIQFAKKNERVMKDGSKSPRKAIDELARYRGDNIRALATVHLSEMLQTSKFEKNTDEHSHQWLDENGWELRTAFIADKTGRVYRATLNIANARDGRRILYAINQIRHIDNRKKASVQAQVPSTVSGAARTKSHDASEVTISESEKKVKERFSYAGENARTANLEALAAAKEMQAQGVADETIRQQTGWHTGMDGKWRWEIDDSTMRYDSSGDLRGAESAKWAMEDYESARDDLWGNADMDTLEKVRAYNRADIAGDDTTKQELYDELINGQYAYYFDQYVEAMARAKGARNAPAGGTLQDYIDHPALFEAYPQLRNVTLRFERMGGGMMGYYSRTDNEIVLNTELRYAAEDTLVHEIQHAIQKAEGFTRGSNEEYWKQRQDGDDAVHVYDAKIQDSEKKMDEIMRQLPENVAEQFRQWSAMDDSSPEAMALMQELWNGPYNDLFEDYWFLNFGLDDMRRTNYKRGPRDLYRNTAGEIEARDVTARRSLTPEQRRSQEPARGDSYTVFMEDSDELSLQLGDRYSVDDTQTYAEIQERQQELRRRELDLQERKRAATNNPELLQAMDEYSNLFTEMRGLLPKRRNGTATQAELDRIEEIKALRDEYMQRITDLQESLGLTAISQEETEIREEKETLRVASDAAWAREGAERENLAIKKAGVSPSEYFRRKAIKAFKTTTNFNEAGYLLPDGKLLNFSGGERNHRYRDHREIGEIYEATNGVAALNRFLADGNIRIMAESPGADLPAGVEPTREQYAALRKFINSNGVQDGRFYVDFSNADGSRAGNYAYEGRIYADRVLNDIKHYYATGETVQRMDLNQFRYSVDDEGSQQSQEQKPPAPKKKIRPVAESRPLIAKKDLRNTVLNLFSIPNGQRAEVGTMIDSYADRLIKNGSLTEDDRKAFFDRMYDAGVMVMPAEEYSAFARSRIADGRIYVSDSVKSDFGDDWADIRRRAFAAGVYLVNDRSASGIDQWNATLSAEDMLPGLFDPEETDERIILERILQVAEEGKDEHLSLAEYTRRLSQQEGISEDEFLDNMERQLDWALRTFAEKARLEVHLRDRTGRKIAQEREKGNQRMTRQQVKEAQRRADERQARKDSARRAKERRELRELQQRTLKQLQWLSKNRNRAPEELKAAWDEVLGDIDLYAISAADEMRWSGKHNATWKDLAQMYKDAMKNDPNFLPSKELERIVTRLDATKIADMDLDALQDLYKAAIGLRTEFYNRNNVINDEMQRLFAEVYTDAKREIESAPGGFTGNVADKFLNLDQLTPMNVLQRMAGWDPDGAFYSMAKQLERGERDMRAYSVKAQKMLQDFLTEHEDWVKKADGQGKDAIWYEVEVPQLLELHMGDKPIFGPTVKVYMTPAQKVHMYLESRNTDNLRHMTGGRTFVNKDLYSRGKRQEALSQGRTIKLAPETVRKLVSDLTAEEMELAQLLDHYYNTFATQEINKVSNILYGYDKAMGKNYAPIYTNRNYTKTEFGVFDTTAEGVGNLKGRQYAVNPSYNISAFDAFERHVDQTARFCGMAIPARNWTTLMNWREKNNSTGDVITHKWGEESKRYITDLITTLQGGDDAKSDTVSSGLSKLQSNYITAIFGANPSIVLKQLGSIPLAGAYLDARNVPTPAQIAGIDRSLISKYTQELEWRTMGYATPETKQLKDNPNWTQTNKAFKFVFGGGAITAMDGWAASTLWPWAENKVRREHPELAVGTKAQVDAGESAFYKKVAEEFENAISRSQSVSDEIHQGTLRKSKNPITRAFTMFRSDSAQTYNALRQKIGEARYYMRTGAKDKVIRTAKKAAGTAFVAMLLNAAWSEAVNFLMALWKNKGKYYRDDEDELTFESVAGEMASSMLGSFAGVVTGGEELLELIGNIITGDTWYGIETPGMEQLNDLLDTLIESGSGMRDLVAGGWDVLKNGGDLGEYFGRHSGRILGSIKDLAETAAMYLPGLPASNLEAYLVGALKWISPKLGAAYDDLFSDVGKSDLAGMEGGALESRIGGILSDRNISESDDTAAALAALYEAGYKTAIPGDTPTSISINGEKQSLGAYQQQAYDTIWGGIVADALNDIVTSNSFTEADPETRAKLLSNLYTYAAERAKAELFDEYEMDSGAAKNAAVVAAGATVAECITWNTITSEMKSGQKAAELASWDIPESAKREIFLNKISDSREDTIAAFRGAGLSFDRFLQAYSKYSEINSMDLKANMKAVEFSHWVNDQNYSAEQAAVVKEELAYFSMSPSRATSYDEMVAAGMDPDDAYGLTNVLNGLQPEEGEEAVSDVQKWRAACEVLPDQDRQLAALKALMNEGTYAELEIGTDYGVEPMAYIHLKELLPQFDEDQNGSYTNAEITSAIEAMSANGTVLPGGDGTLFNLTNEQRAVLWQLYTGSKSAKNNPYDPDVGWEVIEAREANKEE